MSNWKVLIKEDGKIEWWAGMSKWMDEYNLQWKDNWEWEDTITYSGYGRGTSSCVICFKSEALNQHVNMFMTDFNYVVKSLEKGQLKGKFTFCKRGQNYGVKYLG